MASPFPFPSPALPFSASTKPSSSSMAALKLNCPAIFPPRFNGRPWCNRTQSCMLSFKLKCNRTQSCMLSFKVNEIPWGRGGRISCAMNMTAGQSDESGRRSTVEDVMDMARKLWDSSPQPIKSFPWSKALDNFINITLELVVGVIKYLYIPVMATVSLSEMSYCAHERKMSFVPLPLLFGVAVAGYISNKALELSPTLQEEAEVPWHLIATAILFTLIKLPGPYFRYWGRILIPHFASGGILRTLWFMFLWYRRPRSRSSSLTE